MEELVVVREYALDQQRAKRLVEAFEFRTLSVTQQTEVGVSRIWCQLSRGRSRVPRGLPDKPKYGTGDPVSAHRLDREALLITCRESSSHGFRERGLYLFTHLQTLEPSLYPYNILLQ